MGQRLGVSSFGKQAELVGMLSGCRNCSGQTVDRAYLDLQGQVLGITRFGIAKMKDSVFMLASFEKTSDHLFDAALHGRVDTINGVSESIIMGIPSPGGTGMMKLRQASAKIHLPEPRPLPVMCCA